MALAHFMNIQMFIHAKSLEVHAQLHFDLHRVRTGEQLADVHDKLKGIVKVIRMNQMKCSKVERKDRDSPR